MPVGVPEVTNFKSSGMIEVVEVPTIRGPKEPSKAAKSVEQTANVAVTVTDKEVKTEVKNEAKN